MGEGLEARIRAHFDAGRLEETATMALEGYGRELLGYLIATMRSEQDAAEVFSDLSESLWRGLPDFAWRSSFRTWVYVLARNAAAQYKRSPHNQARRRERLSKIDEVAQRVRTQTMPFLRTEVKDRFAELRQKLRPDEQELLILRVNRRMSWKEVAQVVGNTPTGDDQALTREAARLRKQFQVVKERMHELAEKDGLLEVEDRS